MSLAGLKHHLKMLRPAYRAYVASTIAAAKADAPWRELREMPRFKQMVTRVLGPDLIVPDAASFLAMHTEIFTNEIYRFRTDSDRPYIIDCGANIGMSSIYLSRTYPGSEIIAFEADPNIFVILNKNISSFNAQNVQAMNKAVWDMETMLPFAMDGADGGRTARASESKPIINVPAVRLAPYLDRTVDFLKLDIEGAETQVLRDCRAQLGNVKNLFVEYHSFANEEQTIGEVCDIILCAGLRIYIQGVHGTDMRSPFCDVKTESGIDMQVNIYGYRS